MRFFSTLYIMRRLLYTLSNWIQNICHIDDKTLTNHYCVSFCCYKTIARRSLFVACRQLVDGVRSCGEAARATFSIVRTNYIWETSEGKEAHGVIKNRRSLVPRSKKKSESFKSLRTITTSTCSSNCTNRSLCPTTFSSLTASVDFWESTLHNEIKLHGFSTY